MAAAKKVVLFGAGGQIGYELHRLLQPVATIVAPGRDDVSFLEPNTIRDCLKGAQPDLVINAAAYTEVDRAETEEDVATTVNATAVGVVGEEARACGASVIHFSTDYVFDGTTKTSWTESDPTNPVNAYGRSKLAGEQALRQTDCAHAILRTSWVYGNRRKNFYLTMKRLLAERDKLKVVNDQHGVPNASGWLAAETSNLAQRALQEPALLTGGATLHLSQRGATTWYQFACEIERLVYPGANSKILPVGSDEYPTPAKRPNHSVLDPSGYEDFVGRKVSDWRLTLATLVTRDSKPSQPRTPEVHP